jgi:hypothetical protein
VATDSSRSGSLPDQQKPASPLTWTPTPDHGRPVSETPRRLRPLENVQDQEGHTSCTSGSQFVVTSHWRLVCSVASTSPQRESVPAPGQSLH